MITNLLTDYPFLETLLLQRQINGSFVEDYTVRKTHEKRVLRKEKRFTVLWGISIICRILTVISSTDLNHGNAQDFHKIGGQLVIIHSSFISMLISVFQITHTWKLKDSTLMVSICLEDIKNTEGKGFKCLLYHKALAQILMNEKGCR